MGTDDEEAQEIFDEIEQLEKDLGIEEESDEEEESEDFDEESDEEDFDEEDEGGEG